MRNSNHCYRQIRFQGCYSSDFEINLTIPLPLSPVSPDMQFLLPILFLPFCCYFHIVCSASVFPNGCNRTDLSWSYSLGRDGTYEVLIPVLNGDYVHPLPLPFILSLSSQEVGSVYGNTVSNNTFLVNKNRISLFFLYLFVIALGVWLVLAVSFAPDGDVIVFYQVQSFQQYQILRMYKQEILSYRLYTTFEMLIRLLPYFMISKRVNHSVVA